MEKERNAESSYLPGVLQDTLGQELDQITRQDIAHLVSQAIAEIGSWEYNIQNHNFFLSEEVFKVIDLPYIENVEVDTYVKMFHPDDRELLIQMVDRTVKRDIPFRMEARVIPHPGLLKWVHLRGGPVHDDEGKVMMVSGTIHDITERKLVEREQYRRNQVLEAMASGASLSYTLSIIARMLEDFILDGFVGIWNWDASNNSLVWGAGPNMPPGYLENFQLHHGECEPVEEMALDEKTPILIHVETAIPEDRCKSHLQSAGIKRVYLQPVRSMDNQLLGVVAAYFSEDSYELPSALRSLIRTSAQLGAIAFSRYRATKELTYRREFEQLVAQISTNFIQIPAEEVDTTIQAALSRIGKFAKMDRSYIFLTSPDKTKLSNTHEWCAGGIMPQIDFLQKMPISDFPWAGDLIKAVFQIDDAEEIPEEATVEREFLRAHEVKSLLVVPMYLEGEWIGFIGFDAVVKKKKFSAEDVTLLQMVGEIFANAFKRKETEEKLKQANALLEQKVEQRTAALMHSNKSLERFAYMASHDMKEPLRMVISYLQLLERRTKERLSDGEKEFLFFAVDGAKRMNSLLEAILAYSRLNLSGNPMEVVDLGEIMKVVLKNLELMIYQTKAQIYLDKLPSIQADKEQMIQLFQNLVSNGIKFQPKGQHPVISIKVKDKKERIEFYVKDNGIGIPETYHQKIFEVFQRLHARDEYPGSGVGLSMCTEIVRRHGGEIRVESKEGMGTTFIFSLRKRHLAVG